MSVIHAPTKRELDIREAIPLGLVLASLLVMFIRLWYLQVVRGEDLTEKARALRTNDVAKLAPRGLIFDRNGVLVAGVSQEIVVTAKPAEVKRNPWVLAKVSEMVGVPVEKLEDKIRQNAWRPHLPTPVFVGVPLETAARILESAEDLPGIGIESQAMRFYPDTESLCHLLGYVWTPTDRDVERLRALGVKPAEYVGRDGLERVYETELMGQPGTETLEFDSKQRPLRVLARDHPVPGSKLILGIDLKLQQLAEKELSGHRGAVVALDPKTGEVLCLVSTPGFDASLFQKGISTENWNRLRNDKDHPLLNRAIGSRYAPGSTFKIVDAIAAMDAGVWSAGRPTHCAGFFPLTRTRCLGVHGSVSFHRAFAASCNTYFSDLAVRIGPERLKDVATRIGLGHRTGIDLPSEISGLVPSPEWYASRKTPLKWYPGNTVNMGIGQGEVAMTPIEMACLVSLVANEGVSYEPRIVRAVAAHGTKQPAPLDKKILGKIELPSSSWAALKSAMVAVIEDGTARVAQIPGVRWGGKTGSAEHRKAEQTHSWFVGVAPMDSPKIAICVVVEAAGHGSTVAAPIAREVVKAFLVPQPKEASASSSDSALPSTAETEASSPISR